MVLPSSTKDATPISPASRVPADSGGRPSVPILSFLLWSALSAAAIAGVIAILPRLGLPPILIPSVVNTYANIMPANKWVLAQGSAGQLIASTFNYQTGMSDGYRVSNFASGSSVFFSVSPSLKPGQHVAAGDTVGSVYSSEMQERLVALNGELSAAEGQLAVSATGSKSAIVEAAQQRVEAAKRRRADYQLIVVRTQALFHDYLLPPGEYDRVQSTIHNLDDAIAIQQADLDAAKTGEKPEQLAVATAHIAALRDEINSIHSRAATYTLCSPIEGTVSPTFSGDMLLTILATSHYVALMPIRSTDYARVAATPNARVTIVGYSRRVEGRIVAVNRELQMQGAQKVVMATALLDSPPDDLLPGSLARCRIECRPLTPIEQCRAIIHAVASSIEAPGSY